MYVFSIYDTVSEDWSSPFCAKNVEHLKRVLSNVFKQGLILKECYIECFAFLDFDGKVVIDDNQMRIFSNGLSVQYLDEFFADELEKLKEKEVEKDGTKS